MTQSNGSGLVANTMAVLIRLITGVQARWLGDEPTTTPDLDSSPPPVPQRIYYANHQSNLDAPVIWASLPAPVRRRTRPVAARDYWEATPLRRLIAGRGFNAVLIERKKVTRENNPLAKMEAALLAGDSLILFPEGTRAMDDDAEVGEFKPGLFHLARKFPTIELMPVHLENLNRILPKGEFLVIPIIASVRFGKSLLMQPDEEKAAFLNRAREALVAIEDPAEGGAA